MLYPDSNDVVFQFAKCKEPVPERIELQQWLSELRSVNFVSQIVPKTFCCADTRDVLLRQRRVHGKLANLSIVSARRQANVFAFIGRDAFQNRSATKLANIDYVFNNIARNAKCFTSAARLYFADICGGPGGFTEFMLKRQPRSYGIGITLKSAIDFSRRTLDIDEERFVAHYGFHGDGNVCNSQNVISFADGAKTFAQSVGVHVAFADGACDVSGREEDQEQLNRQLIMCEILCALSALRTGGNFICKFFDTLSPFTAGLIYLLYRSFSRISIIKPLMSRATNGERYLVCESKCPNTESVQHLLLTVNNIISAGSDVRAIVPDSRLVRDEKFLKTLRQSNEHLASTQSDALRALHSTRDLPRQSGGERRALVEAIRKRWNI
jgi:cap1 methyltransferase